LGAIREQFLHEDLRSKFHSPAIAKEGSGNNPPPWETDDPKDALDPAAAEKKRQAVQDWITQIANSEKHPGTSRNTSPSPALSGYNRSPLSIHHLPDRQSYSPHPNPLPEGEGTFAKEPGTERYSAQSPDTAEDRIAFSQEGHLVVQMLDRYLVMETDEGIAFVDQHALHERILYEQLKERMSSGQLESQRLLVPIPVDLSPNEFSCVQENGEFFKTLGLHVEPFGGNTVLISAFPAVLAKTSPMDVFLSMVEPLVEWGKKLRRDELLDELLHSMACKAAVKAGERLSSASMQHLIQLAEGEINAHHCPHGRPSTIVFTREEIDKMFERT
jgi:DNA mismatch repair protein MutL